MFGLVLGHCKKKTTSNRGVWDEEKKLAMTRGTDRSNLLTNAILFLTKRRIVGLKIQTVDKNVMPTSTNEKIFLKESKNLDFYATLGENNEGCQELSYSATRHKKVHYSAVKWHYLSSTLELFSSTVP